MGLKRLCGVAGHCLDHRTRSVDINGPLPPVSCAGCCMPFPTSPRRFSAIRASATCSEETGMPCTAAACDKTSPVVPTSMPSVTGPAPPSDRARPNCISRSQSGTPNLPSPSFARSIASVAAFDRCGGLPTAAMSSICRSTRSANLVRRPIRALTGVSLRSTASSATKGQRRASSRRRNVSLT